MSKTLGILLAIAVLAVAVGGYFFPQIRMAVGAPAGSTFNDAKITAIAMAPQSSAATTTSILNTDASDRIITDAGVSCTGLTNMFGITSAGLATYAWTAATSSTPAPGASIATNALAAMQVTVATSSSDGFTATSTYTNVFARRWNAGSYMIFQTNGTSSAVTCVPFLHYIGT